MRRNLLLIVLACALLAAAAASLMSQTLVGPAKPSRSPASYGSSTKPPQTAVPPTSPGTTCPCFTAASIQALLDACGNFVKSCDPGVAGPTLTLRGVCLNAPIGPIAWWAQLTDAGGCSTTIPDPVTGEPAAAPQVVNGTQRADCTAILVSKCP